MDYGLIWSELLIDGGNRNWCIKTGLRASLAEKELYFLIYYQEVHNSIFKFLKRHKYFEKNSIYILSNLVSWPDFSVVIQPNHWKWTSEGYLSFSGLPFPLLKH